MPASSMRLRNASFCAMSTLTSLSSFCSALIAASTIIYSVPAGRPGLYRVSFYSKITTAGTGSVQVLGGTQGFQVHWQDLTDSVSMVEPVLNSLGTSLVSNTTSTVEAGSAVFSVKGSTNISYSYDYLSSGNTLVYKLSIRVERERQRRSETSRHF